MKQALFGFRKIILYAVTLAAVVVLCIVALDVLKVISDAKATQAAAIVVAAFGSVTGIFTTLMSAFKAGYERDSAVEVAKVAAPAPPGAP
jgi:ABC-type molybdate transport system substrate-binding protein